MKQFRLLLLLALLMTAATGAWAQSATTHVVTQATVNDIFSGDGYTLGDAVAAGDVLDFQGTIDLGAGTSHTLVVNKRVSIISSTQDAVINLRTQSGAMMGDDPGNSFVINKDASGTTVEGIRFDNTQVWLFNTSNVTFTGVTFHVEGVRVGASVGQVSIRYSDHVTFDGCTVYAKDNGGSSGCMLVGSHDCTFKDTRFEGEGTCGNLLYLGSTANSGDKPADYTMNADNISVLNCTLTKDVASPICMFIVGGLRHHIEGCTIENLAVSSGWGTTTPTSADEGHTFLNNTFICSTTIPVYSTAENNTVTGTFTLYEGATATGNTVSGDVTVKQDATATGNTITGNVSASGADAIVQGNTITGNITLSSTNITVTGNIVQGKLTTGNKTATITGNSITSTEEYAVYLNSTAADANNTVTNNNLRAATKAGDAAVYIKKPEANTVSDNFIAYNVKMADGTMDAANWSTTPAEAMTIGVTKDQSVTLNYSGRLKVKAVTATFEPDPLATPLTIEAVTPGTIQVLINGELSTGMKYSKDGGTTKTLITKSTEITVAKGDKVQFYGNGTQTQVYGRNPEVSIRDSGEGFQTKVYGNIMSLLDEDNFATMTDLPSDKTYVFHQLFYGNKALTDASELLLPATKLTDGCYHSMFYGCSSLTAAPKLPATTLAAQCYNGMFGECTSLTSAYVKAAYADGNYQCNNMFGGYSAAGAVLHTTSDNKESWEAKMGPGKTWSNWSVADDWQE